MANNRERQSAEATAQDSPAVRVIGGILGSGLWLTLGWIVYWRLPRFRRVFMDLGNDPGTPTLLVLKYAVWALPIIAIAAGFAFAATRSRWLRLFLLAGVPALLILGLFATVGQSVFQLLEELS